METVVENFNFKVSPGDVAVSNFYFGIFTNRIGNVVVGCKQESIFSIVAEENVLCVDIDSAKQTVVAILTDEGICSRLAVEIVVPIASEEFVISITSMKIVVSDAGV